MPAYLHPRKTERALTCRVVSKVDSNVSFMGLRPAEEDSRRTPALFTILVEESSCQYLLLLRHDVAIGR